MTYFISQNTFKPKALTHKYFEIMPLNVKIVIASDSGAPAFDPTLKVATLGFEQM
jgi:hypothetical protein